MFKYILTRLALAVLTILSIIIINYCIFYYLKDYTILNLQLFSNSSYVQLGSTKNLLSTTNLIVSSYDFTQDFLIGLYLTIINLVSFNFGNSIFYNQPILNLITLAIKKSLFIGFFSVIFMYIFAYIISIIYITHKKQNYFLYVLAIFYSVPIFVLAYLTIYFTNNNDMIYAIIVIVLNGIMFLTLLLINTIAHQNNLLSVIFFKQNNNTINIIKLHNIMLLLISDLSAIIIGVIFGTSSIVEIIFNINGIGNLMYTAFKNLDYPLLLAIVYIISLLTVFIKLATDIIIFKNDKTIVKR